MSVPGSGELAGLTVGAFPHYPNNPWQRMLYRDAVARGATIRPFASLDELLAAIPGIERPERFVLHVNWTAAVSQQGATVLESMHRVRSFLAAVADLTARGGRVIWTIHNVLPHEMRFHLPELFLLAGLAEAATTIVIMNPATVDAVGDLYPLPQHKVVLIAHPSYVGEYPDAVSRAEARASFGLAADDIVAVSLGVIRPYKNIERLAAALTEARVHEPRLRLLVGGEVGPGTDPDRLGSALAAPGAVSEIGYVSDDHVQRWLRAADFAVFAFGDILNTGSLMLAATFGVPALVTDLPATRELAREEWVLTVPPELSTRQLADGLLQASAEFPGDDAVRRSALAYAARFHPAAVSAEFTRVVAGVTRDN